MKNIENAVSETFDEGIKGKQSIDKIIAAATDSAIVAKYGEITNDEEMKFLEIHRRFTALPDFYPYRDDILFMFTFANKVKTLNYRLRQHARQMTNKAVVSDLMAGRASLAGRF